MPSFGNGVTAVAPNRRVTLVSFSQNSGSGLLPSGAGPARSSSEPRNGCSVVMAAAAAPAAAPVLAPAPASLGLGAPSSQDQVLRNHAVGSTCTVSTSGPALVTRIVIRMSVGS